MENSPDRKKLKREKTGPKNYKKHVIWGIGISFVLSVILFSLYKYTKTKAEDIILPGGITYLAISPTPTTQPVPTPTPRELFRADDSIPWIKRSGYIYPYSFSYPQSLELVVFPNDPTDSIAIVWKDFPPQKNILLNVEVIEDRDPTLVGKSRDYVENWHKYFSGLIATKEIDEFTNINGIKGYRAVYINSLNETPVTDYFLVPSDRFDVLIHMANGFIDPAVFEKMIDSFNWKE